MPSSANSAVKEKGNVSNDMNLFGAWVLKQNQMMKKKLAERVFVVRTHGENEMRIWKF